MANNPVTRHVVKYKGTGNVQVFPNLPTMINDAQDGADVGTGGPALADIETATPLGSFAANRNIEFLDDRYVLTGNGGVANSWGVYKKNLGGAGQWGNALPSSAFLTSQSGLSGIHVVHPDGVPTLIWFGRRDFSTALVRYESTDGVNWTLSNVATGTNPSSWGQSMVYRTAVFFLINHTALTGGGGTGALRAYDLVTTALTAYDTSLIFNANIHASGYAIHVHEGVVFMFGWSITGGAPYKGRVAKLAAGAFVSIYQDTTQGALDTNTYGHSALFTDPGSGDLVLVMSEETSAVAGAKVVSFADATGAATPTDRSSAVMGAVEGADKYLPGGGAGHRHRRWSVFVDTQTAPATPRTYLTTWIPGGNTETWEWKGFAEMEAVASLQGVSDDFCLPYDTVGGGDRSPSTSRISMTDQSEVAGGTELSFQVRGLDTARTATFRGVDDEGSPDTVLPIVPASLTIGAGFLTDLEAYYHMNEASGTRVDASGNGLDLAQFGTVSSGTGVIGNGADFAGSLTLDYLARAGDDPALTIGQNLAPFAISVWLDLDAWTAGQIASICSKSNGSSNGWTLQVQIDGSVDFVFHTGLTLSTLAGEITVGAGLQHIVVTSDGGTIRIYIDGVEKITGTPTATVNSTTPFRVGNRSVLNHPVDGVLDELAVWTRNLDVNEVGYLNNAGSGFLLEGTTPFAVAPSISGNTIINLLPDGGATPYTVELTIDTPGADIDEGDVGLIIADLV